MFSVICFYRKSWTEYIYFDLLQYIIQLYDKKMTYSFKKDIPFNKGENLLHGYKQRFIT